MPPSDKSEIKLLADAIGEAVRSNRPQGPLEQAGFSPEQVAQLTELPKAKKWREVACKSEETGASFIAVVVESKAFPAGRIVELKSYLHPAGVASYQREGGLVPDGMQIMRAGMAAPDRDPNAIPKQDYTPFYLQWRWSEFWKRDLRRYIGTELKSHLVTTPAAMATPWQEGRIRGDDA